MQESLTKLEVGSPTTNADVRSQTFPTLVRFCLHFDPTIPRSSRLCESPLWMSLGANLDNFWQMQRHFN